MGASKRSEEYRSILLVWQSSEPATASILSQTCSQMFNFCKRQKSNMDVKPCLHGRAFGQPTRVEWDLECTFPDSLMKVTGQRLSEFLLVNNLQFSVQFSSSLRLLK